METRAVLDTNVILAAQVSQASESPNREIVNRWQIGEFHLLLTEDIVAEYIEKLQFLGKASDQIIHFASRLLLLSEMVEIRFFHLRHYPDDMDDVAFFYSAPPTGTQRTWSVTSPISWD